MGRASMTMETLKEVDYSDIQALVCFGFGRLKARYKLLHISNPAAARSWLSSALSSHAVNDSVLADMPPETGLQIAFTAPGRRAVREFYEKAMILRSKTATRTGPAQIDMWRGGRIRRETSGQLD